MDEDINRRSVLRIGGPAAVGLLAGCSGGSSGTDGGGGDATTEKEAESVPESTETASEGEETQSEAEETEAMATVLTTLPKPDGPEEVTTTEIDRSDVTTTKDAATTVSELPDDSGGCEYGTIQPDADRGTVSLWHARTEAGAELVQTAQDRFNGDTRHMLATSRIPNANFIAKLRSAIPSGDGPYLFEWSHDRAGQFDRRGFLSDQAGRVDIPDCMITDTALDAAEYRGKRIGVPWAAETVALMYNKDIVDTPPETLSEMKAIMADYHDPDSGQFGLGLPVNPYYVSGFAQAYGEEIYNGKEDRLGLDSDAVEKGLRIVTEDLRPYMPDDPGPNAQRSVFADGDAPFFISGPWDVAGLRRDVDLGLTTLPELPDGGTPRPYTGVKLLYFASKMNDGSAAAAARDFTEWFASNERVLIEHANRGNFIPVHTKLAGNPEMPEPVKAFAAQVEDGYPMPQNPKMNQVWGPYGDAVVQTFNGNGDLGDNLAAAAESIRDAWSS